MKENVCDFKGTILIDQIYTYEEPQYGVDMIYADSNIQEQGIIIAHYRIEEYAGQPNSGVFNGTLYTKWYIDAQDEIRYDDIQSYSDGYMNNAYIGEWTSHESKNSKVCNWGDYRVPLANHDFDIGAAMFSPSEKYYDQGWKVYQDAWLYSDEEAREKELSTWWK